MSSFLALGFVGLITLLMAITDRVLGQNGGNVNVTLTTMLVAQSFVFFLSRFIIGRKVSERLDRPSSASSETPRWMIIGSQLFADKSPKWLAIYMVPLGAMVYLTRPALIHDDVGMPIWTFATFTLTAMASALAISDHAWKINWSRQS